LGRYLHHDLSCVCSLECPEHNDITLKAAGQKLAEEFQSLVGTPAKCKK